MLKELAKIANSLDLKGFTKEADRIDLLIKKIAEDDIDLNDPDIEFEPYGHYELNVYPEPPVNIEDVKAAFVNQFMKSRSLLKLEVTSIKWNSKPSEYPHYNVKSVGLYYSEITGSVEEYRIDIDFMLQDWGEPVEGTDGKIYHFYGED